MSTVDTSLIAENARDAIPIAWEALKRASAPAPGTTEPAVEAGIFQRKLDVVQIELFGVVIDDVTEAALDSLVLEYAGKILALKLIPAALDFWASQTTSVTASGRQESKVYTDRAAQLRELRKILLEDTRSMWSEVSVLLPNSSKAVRTGGIPRVTQVGESTTPDPFDFEPLFAELGVIPGTRGTL